MIRSTKKRKTNLADTMRSYVQKRFPNGIPYRVLCDNCGKAIMEIKFENISHTKTRGSRPDLREDHDNLKILCGPTDYWGEKDTSCHSLWDAKKFDEYQGKSKWMN